MRSRRLRDVATPPRRRRAPPPPARVLLGRAAPRKAEAILSREMRAAMMYMVWRSSSPCAVVMTDGRLAELAHREGGADEPEE